MVYSSFRFTQFLFVFGGEFLVRVVLSVESLPVLFLMVDQVLDYASRAVLLSFSTFFTAGL